MPNDELRNLSNAMMLVAENEYERIADSMLAAICDDDHDAALLVAAFAQALVDRLSDRPGYVKFD
jgi:hypothetical protein